MQKEEAISKTIHYDVEKDNKILLSFGLIADIQYADKDDGWDYHKVNRRYYRQALEHLQSAVDTWNTFGNLDFIVNLGDAIDGHNFPHNSQDAFSKVINCFQTSSANETHHCLGNQDLYNVSREEFSRILPAVAQGKLYYDFTCTAAKNIRFVILDSYDVSLLGYPIETPHYKEAYSLLHTKNPNDDKNSPEGLEGVEKRFVKFNGGIGVEQLNWLRDVLNDADSMNQHVIIFSHVPIHPDICAPACLLWNYAEVLDVLRESSSVSAYICGHCHEDGYVHDSDGIHYLVLDAVLECEANAFGIASVFTNRIEIKGYGDVPSRTLYFRNLKD